MHAFPAEGEQGDPLPSCFNSYTYRSLLARNEKGALQGWECKEEASHAEKYQASWKEVDLGSNASPASYYLGNPSKLLRCFEFMEAYDPINLL